jgi:hypothetical protein
MSWASGGELSTEREMGVRRGGRQLATAAPGTEWATVTRAESAAGREISRA